MRNQSPIDALFPAIRKEILAATLLSPARAWYQSDLARHLGRTDSSLQRELASLADAGILSRWKEGNRVYVRADTECPFYEELRSLMLKTAGLVDALREALDPLRDRVRIALVFGSIARAEETSTSDIDLLVIGNATLADLAPPIADAEKRLARPINVSAYTPAEFARRRREGHHFVRSILEHAKMFVIGDEHELAEITE